MEQPQLISVELPYSDVRELAELELKVPRGAFCLGVRYREFAKYMVGEQHHTVERRLAFDFMVDRAEVIDQKTGTIQRETIHVGVLSPVTTLLRAGHKLHGVHLDGRLYGYWGPVQNLPNAADPIYFFELGRKSIEKEAQSE